MSTIDSESTVCPRCQFRWNPPGATTCQVCGASLAETAPEPVAAGGASLTADAASGDSPLAPPVSAPPYPPTSAPKPPAAPVADSGPVAAPISPLFGGTLTGEVTQIEQVEGRPPLTMARWLTMAAVLIGLVPLVTIPSIGVVRGALAMAAAGVLLAVLFVASGSRRRQLLRVVLDTPVRGLVKLLMVDATGRPAAGDTVEAYGQFLASRQFFAVRMRVTASKEADAAASPLAGAGMTYIGRKRLSMWMPLLVLLFAAAFWSILSFELAHLWVFRSLFG